MRSRATALVLGAARALSAKNGRASTWPSMQRVKEVGYASFNYCAPDVTAVSTRRDVAGSDGELEGAAWSPTTVRIHDGEGDRGRWKRTAFDSSRPIDADLDLYGDAAVTGRYYSMCEAGGRAVPGRDRAAFDLACAARRARPRAANSRRQ